jgi:hypothetical protein
MKEKHPCSESKGVILFLFPFFKLLCLLIKPYITFVSRRNYFTSLEMMGATLTVMKLDDELKEMLDMPVSTMGLTQR